MIAMLEAAVTSPVSDDEASLSSQLYDMAQTLAAELQQLVFSPDKRQQDDSATDVIKKMHAMIDFCTSAEADAADAAVEDVQPAASAEHMLAAAGVVSVCAQLLHASLPSGNSPREAFCDTVDQRPLVAQTATLLLSTLAAKHDAHAWFSGSGAIPGLVSALSYGLRLIEQQHDASDRLLPPDEHGAEGAVEPLAASSLANLAWHDGTAGGSSAVAKEMLRVGAVVPLLATLARGHLRSAQWAAAALCNLSMHGDKARAELAGKDLAVGSLHALSASPEIRCVAASTECTVFPVVALDDWCLLCGSVWSL